MTSRPDENNAGTSSCELPFESLVDYAEGRLRGAALEEFNQHLQAGCPRCAANLAWLNETLALMRSDDMPEPPAKLLGELHAIYPSSAHAGAAMQWQILPEATTSRRRRPWLWIGMAVALVLLLAGIGAYFWADRRLEPRTAVLVAIERGKVEASGASDAPWLVAKEGQVLSGGYLLRTVPNTVATIRFFDESYMRLESSGEWRLVRLESNGTSRLSRVVVKQNAGRASYVSVPLQAGRDAQLDVMLPGATATILGAVTLITGPGGATQLTVLQGDCRIMAGERRLSVEAGQTVLLAPDAPPTLVTPTPGG